MVGHGAAWDAKDRREISAEERLNAYEVDEACHTAFAKAGRILLPYCDELADNFWQRFCALGDDGSGLVGEAREKATERTSHYLKMKFSSEINKDWMDRAGVLGGHIYGSGIEPFAAMGSLSSICDEGTSHLINALLDSSTQERSSVIRAFNRINLMEAELIMSRMRVIMGDKMQERLKAQGEHFRNQITNAVTAASTQSRTAREHSASAATATRGMIGKAAEVAAAAEQSATAMREAAETSTGLIHAIDETRKEVDSASNVVDRASDQAQRAMNTADNLAENAKSIESIISLIRDIAGQTNLLALNATIEAARAGDSGRGFAVVASEVKSLAGQTARATDDIAQKINAIQESTIHAVSANRSTLETIEGVRGSAERIREAMDRQSTTVTMITGSIDETALSADSMSAAIMSIRATVESMDSQITDVENASSSVDAQLAELHENADDFMTVLKA